MERPAKSRMGGIIRQHQLLQWLATLLLLAAVSSKSLLAAPMTAHVPEGSIHGYLALRSMDGKTLAAGDLIQLVHGNRITSRLIFRFRDGSIDSETAVFAHRPNYRLLRDRHIQKGPSFPHPMDMTIRAADSQMTVRFQDKDGHTKVDNDHIDLPPDLSNGMLWNLLRNLDPHGGETKLPYLAATPKPRLITLSISPQQEDSFQIAGSSRKATRFAIKMEAGGLAGLIAPVLGKQPPDLFVWIASGDAPCILKIEGPLFLGGPVWRIEMTSPVWNSSPSTTRK